MGVGYIPLKKMTTEQKEEMVLTEWIAKSFLEAEMAGANAMRHRPLVASNKEHPEWQ